MIPGAIKSGDFLPVDIEVGVTFIHTGTFGIDAIGRKGKISDSHF